MQGWAEVVQYFIMIKNVREEEPYIKSAIISLELLDQLSRDQRFERCKLSHSYLAFMIRWEGSPVGPVYVGAVDETEIIIVPNFVSSTLEVPHFFVQQNECIETLATLLDL